VILCTFVYYSSGYEKPFPFMSIQHSKKKIVETLLLVQVLATPLSSDLPILPHLLTNSPRPGTLNTSSISTPLIIVPSPLPQTSHLHLSHPIPRFHPSALFDLSSFPGSRTTSYHPPCLLRLLGCTNRPFDARLKHGGSCACAHRS
jgi:hypothetical protein